MLKNMILPIFAFALILFSLGCGSAGTGSVTPSQLDSHIVKPILESDAPVTPDVDRNSQITFGEPCVATLYAGQTIDVGTVTVSNDFDNLYVTYETTGDWYILATHLDVENSPAGFPVNKAGNPIVGHFAYSDTFNPPVQTITYTIPLSQFGDDDELCIAAHAVVGQMVNGQITQTQTGWADGSNFPGKNWATYFCCSIKDCDYSITPPLPTQTVCGTWVYPGANSYWEITLDTVPPGFIVSNMTYKGWCHEPNITLSPGYHCNVQLYSSYDPSLPPGEAGDWARINYVINHKGSGASIQDIQDAIWWFTGAGPYPSDPDAIAMVVDATANGAGFEPGIGQILAVICSQGPDLQGTFIEVELECVDD